MKRKSITETQIVEMTRETLHGFYGRSVNHLVHLLSDNFVWIGAFDFQFTHGKQHFIDTVQAELNSVVFNINEEHYELIVRHRDMFIVCCKLNLSSDLDSGAYLQMHTRLSVVWKYIDEELKLVHIHGSNAQDIPLTVQPNTSSATNNPDNFIEHIISSSEKKPLKKIMFRKTTGEYCVISENDILYLQAVGQNTQIHTKDTSVLVSGVLLTHQQTLSDNFFRSHKSYLINTAYITAFRRYQVDLGDQISLPLGREKYLSLKQLCVQFGDDTH